VEKSCLTRWGDKLLDRLSFVIGEAFVALRRNFAMTFASVTTGAVALFLLGMLVYAYSAANNFLGDVPGMFDMRVFLRDGIQDRELRATIDSVRRFNGVKQVIWIPRGKEWAKMQHDHPELTAGITNPFPEELKVVVSDIQFSDRIASEIQSLPTVLPEDGVRYLRKEQKVAIAVLKTFRFLGPSLVVLLMVATGILVYNTIRLTVLSRRLEVRIMQLVGATRFVVRFPFLIEGTVQGLLAGVCAASLLLLTHHVVSDQLLSEDIRVMGFNSRETYGLLCLVGASYGLCCSLVAVRSPLRYR